MELIWPLIIVLLWVGLFSTAIGKILSYLSIPLIGYAVISMFSGKTDETPSTKKIVGYAIALAACSMLAVYEFSNHGHSCAGSYNVEITTSGRQTDNPFAQGQVTINETNRGSVCSQWYTSKACKEYDSCMKNPFSSIWFFLCLVGTTIAGTLLYTELQKPKPGNANPLAKPGISNKQLGARNRKEKIEEFAKIRQLREALVKNLPNLTVEEISEQTSSTRRSTIAWLSRNGYSCKDWSRTPPTQQTTNQRK